MTPTWKKLFLVRTPAQTQQVISEFKLAQLLVTLREVDPWSCLRLY